MPVICYWLFAMRIAVAIYASLLGVSAFAEEAKENVTKVDFEKYDAAVEPDDLFIIEGTFKIVAEEKNKILELAAAPVVESGIIFGKSLKGGGTIRAKIKAGKKRRAAPRFGVGMHGISGFRFRVVPARKLVELVKDEEAVKTVKDVKWTGDTWYQLELAVTPDGEKWKIECRLWEASAERPEKPLLTHTSDEKPGQGKASIWGTAYASKPIYFDDVEIVTK